MKLPGIKTTFYVLVFLKCIIILLETQTEQERKFSSIGSLSRYPQRAAGGQDAARNLEFNFVSHERSKDLRI